MLVTMQEYVVCVMLGTLNIILAEMVTHSAIENVTEETVETKIKLN